MTIDEIISLVTGAYGAKYQLTDKQIVANINYIQQFAFNADLTAFADYTSVLTLDSLNPQGPYPYLDPVAEGKAWGLRKVIGISAASEAAIASALINRKQSVDYSADYGVSYDLPNTDAGDIFANLSIQDPIGRVIKFASIPSEDAEYKWVYFRSPIPIDIENDSSAGANAKLILPDQWHYNVLVLGSLALSERDTWGSDESFQTLNRILKPVWNDLQSNYSSVNGYISEVN